MAENPYHNPITEHPAAMASITYDGQSFLIDGRRVWIVSGSVAYFRVPRAQWAARLAAAKHAGLNCIETPVVWARHEPRQGHLDFTGENDLRHFVQLIAQAGMYCILRPGPYVGQGLDLGGLPPWLLAVPNMQLRTANAPFLEACSRYITALAAQVRDLQVTSPGAGGPILLIQNESRWTCGHDDLARQYLGELNRYFREAGLTVPTLNANELWQSVEGEIDAWSGFDNLLAMLRQLAHVRADQPRLVIDFKLGSEDVWGRLTRREKGPGLVARRLAEVLAAGGQFNLSPFHGGTNLGFSAGRLSDDPESFRITSNDQGAPLSETGRPAGSFGLVRRLCTFASRFARVLANLEPARHPVIQHPGAVAVTAAGKPVGPVVVHAPGSAGSIAFVFGSPDGPPAREPILLLLPDGTTLPVHLPDDGLAWCLFDARITGRTQLDYCNLSAFAVLGKALVLFGAPGSRGLLSINGSPLELDVPAAGSAHPATIEHEGVLVVVCTPAQIDGSVLTDELLYLGATAEETGVGGPGATARATLRVTSAGEVFPHRASPERAAGRVSSSRRGSPAPPAPASAPAKRAPASPPRAPRAELGHWELASAGDHAAGISPRYATIRGPATLDALGAPYGYGWYRVRLVGGSGRSRLFFPHAAHRLHLFVDGVPAGVVGSGPGAEPDAAVTLKAKGQTLVVLAENFGRFSEGPNLSDRTGLFGHIYSGLPVRLGTPKVLGADPVDAMAFRAPLWGVQRGEATDPGRITWTITHRRKTPLFLRLGQMPTCGVILLNNEPLKFFDQAGIWALELDAERLGRGNNQLQLALLGPRGVAAAHQAEIARAVTLVEGEENLTTAAEWAFAKWEPPGSEAFARPPKAGAGKTAGPAWWRGRLEADESELPLVLEATGLSKGQLYVNDRHAGRYFVSTGAGKPVGPQTRYLLPRPWLRPGEPNHVVLFDEHGATPAR
ncbi:MAG TPA: beta-galactosidase, partial [Phycisphaerales bacterium]|nr:beta-galactosidase [Phycisphaerales bacterium]